MFFFFHRPLQESKGSVAVRMALGETQIVQETRQFLLDNQVSLDSFSQVSRGSLSPTILAMRVCGALTWVLLPLAPRCPIAPLPDPGRGSEEHNRDSGEKPSGRSDGGGPGGTLLRSRLPGPRPAASLGPHCHRGVPGAHRGQTSLQEAGLQQGAWSFSPATPLCLNSRLKGL